MPPGLKLPQLPQPQSPSIQPPKPKTGKSEYDQMADDADESASSIKLMESSSPVKESVGVSPLAFPGGNFAMRELAAALNTSSVMAKLKPPLADVIRDLVLNLPSADVLRPELEPHVTIAASLLTDDVDSVVSFVRDEGPFLVTIGELSVFPADGDRQSDVLKLDVSSDVLNSLHLRLKTAIRNLQTYPTYKPHITLAYMRPGTASKYAGRCALTGQRFYVSDVVFSDSNKQHTIISLTGVLAAEAQAKTQRLCEVLETATCLTDALEFYP
jgi:2'-5' RNA ligase